MPALTPVTVPVALTLAMALLALLHTPPVVASVRVTEEPAHTVVGPDMVPADGAGLIVTVVVAATVPQPLVME